ncbi:MAG TPA: PTS glucose transporter subunit IIA [Lachnospiraceae bacterium]|nr:PTS glucose transporter subunit IIA [Lachnospiraceae bacterium]
MKDKIFAVLQRIGRSFMLPIAILPVAGILLGLGSVFTNETTLETYHLVSIFGEGTIMWGVNTIFKSVGNAIFNNLAVLFAIGVAIGMAKKEKEVAALAAFIAYVVMNTSINGMLLITGQIDSTGAMTENATILSSALTQSLGITTMQMGVFGGIIVGLGVAALHNRFYKIQLPNAISFFGGSRFVPIISTIVYTFVGILLYFVWPPISVGINALGGAVQASGYLGTFLFGVIKRALIPFGLHHVFYMPFWQTAVGGTEVIDGVTYYGGQNIFFAELAHSSEITHFSANACRYFSGEFIFMIFGLPGAALAMYQTAKPNKKKQAGGLLLSAALASMLTGITEPIEFSFLFAAPELFLVQVLLAGSCYMVAHILNIAVGVTFSGGLLDLLFFGILQGNAKTSWLLILPCGVVYFFLYYFIFKYLIKKHNFKTPGREDDDEDTHMHSKAEYLASKGKGDSKTGAAAASGGISETIANALGGKANLSDVDACATRLRVTVKKPELVNDALLKSTGAAGIVHKGQGIQVIYGPNVAVIKSNLEDYLDNAPDVEVNTNEAAPEAPAEAPKEEAKPEKKKKLVKVVKISSPMNGTAMPLSEMPDEGFAQGMMGLGAAVVPADGTVYAPEDGEISLVFDTKHAIGITTDSGVELLIHVGVDTVALKGQGFTPLVNTGDTVKKGQPIMKIDLDFLKSHAPSVATPILDTEADDENKKYRLLTNGPVKAGEELFAIDYYEDEE